MFVTNAVFSMSTFVFFIYISFKRTHAHDIHQHMGARASIHTRLVAVAVVVVVIAFWIMHCARVLHAYVWERVYVRLINSFRLNEILDTAKAEPPPSVRVSVGFFFFMTFTQYMLSLEQIKPFLGLCWAQQWFVFVNNSATTSTTKNRTECWRYRDDDNKHGKSIS